MTSPDQDQDQDQAGLRWSVVVPTYDRPERLRACLAALVATDLPAGSVEVVVVDDGGARPAAPVVAELADGPVLLRVHRQDNAGPATARNTGARLARAPRLAFTDDDCAPTPGWLLGLDRALSASPDALVGGRTVNALTGDGWAEATQLVTDHVVETTPGGFLPSCNLGVLRWEFLARGGFDEHYPAAAGEDRALCDTWRAAGGAVRLVPDAVVHHAHSLDLRGFWRQHAGYGAAARTVHAAPGGSRPGRAGDYLGLLGRGRTGRSATSGAAMVGRLLVSQVATAWGYGRAGLDARRSSGPVGVR